MITSYQIRKMINGEEALILYIQMEEEFSLEWFEKLKSQSFQNFIRDHKIIWNGTKVFLVVGGITLAVLNYQPSKTHAVQHISDTLLTPLIVEKSQIHLPDGKVYKEDPVQENISIEEVKESSSNSNPGSVSTPSVKPPSKPSNTVQSTSPSQSHPSSADVEEELDTTIYVTVYRSNGSVVRLTMTDYLIGVVAAEMPASFQVEALKAQSILARTYAMKVISRNGKLTDTVSTQRYIDTKEMQKQWGTSYDLYYQKIRNAVFSTGNLVITYQGTLIDAVYHSTSNGKTEDSEAVWGNAFPYLQSVDSRWDISQSSYMRTVQFSKVEFLQKFGLTEDLYSVEILGRNRSGRISSIKVGTTVYTGVQFRSILNLRSADFDISLSNEGVSITTRGYGHGVGLSQYGANGMAKEGHSAINILKHYYAGVKIVEMVS